MESREDGKDLGRLGIFAIKRKVVDDEDEEADETDEEEDDADDEDLDDEDLDDEDPDEEDLDKIEDPDEEDEDLDDLDDDDLDDVDVDEEPPDEAPDSDRDKASSLNPEVYERKVVRPVAEAVVLEMNGYLNARLLGVDSKDGQGKFLVEVTLPKGIMSMVEALKT